MRFLLPAGSRDNDNYPCSEQHRQICIGLLHKRTHRRIYQATLIFLIQSLYAGESIPQEEQALMRLDAKPSPNPLA
jgi:hypothetical protein